MDIQNLPRTSSIKLRLLRLMIRMWRVRIRTFYLDELSIKSHLLMQKHSSNKREFS